MMGGMTDATTDDVRPLSELLLAGVGWATLGVEAADELADDLARRVGVDRDEMRSALKDTVRAWRADAERVGTRRDEALDRVLQKSGLARREELDDLALRIAQVEHRLRLLERESDAAQPTPPA